MNDPAAKRPARPFPGLRPFEAHEWSIFFGRERMIDDVIDRLARNRLVLIHGASGSGKSSLVRAGVMPKLARQFQRHGEPWLTCAMRPSGGPLWNLATEFARLEGRASDPERIGAIVGLFNRRGANLAGVAGAIEGMAGKSLCILVDQFEELFRFEKETSREEAGLFVDLIARAAPEGDGPPVPGAVDVHVVVTMRSEFLGECARFDGLAETINRTQYLVPRMDDDSLIRAIRRPAQMFGGFVEEALADRLVASVRGREDELPLLQHGLMLMWEEATRAAAPGARIALDGAIVENAGGLADLLSRHADTIMQSVAPDDRRAKIVETVFRELTDVNAEGSAIRRPRSFQNLAAIAGARPDELRPILDAFRAPGVSFLTPYAPAPISETTIVDISHEALIRCWRKIEAGQDGWLKQEFDDGLAWRSLLVEAKSFETNPRRILSAAAAEDRSHLFTSRGDLWSQRYGGGNSLVGKLLEASRRAAAKSRRIAMITMASLGALAMILGGVSHYALNQKKIAEQQTHAAEDQRAAAFQATREARNQRDIAERLTREADAQRAVAERGAKVALSGQFAAAVTALSLAVVPINPTRALKLALAGWPRNSGDQAPQLGVTLTAIEAAVLRSRERMILSGHTDAVRSAAFSPDGARIVTASGDRTARVWDARTGKAIAVLAGHEDSVRSAAFSPDGGRIVTASWDMTARLWDARTGKAIAVLAGHEGWVTSAAFSPDGGRIVTASYDNTARVWDARTGNVIAVLAGHTGGVESAAFSPDGGRIVTASDDNTARVWDARTGKVIAVLVGHEDQANSAAFSPDGGRIVTASNDNTARLWDARTGKAIAVLAGHNYAVGKAMFSPDGARILTASYDNTACLWDASTGKQMATLVGHNASVLSAVFSPDGTQIVTGSNDNTARLWDARTGKAIAVLAAHNNDVNSATFSPDGTQIVTASGDHTARVWDAATGKAIATLAGHSNWVASAAFSPDGARIVTASLDSTARLWDARTGKAITVLAGHESDVYSAAFSPDAGRIVTASKDKTARVWDAVTGEPIAVLAGHDGPVYRAAFSPDGGRIVTASGDKTARVWDAQTGKVIAVMAGHEDSVMSAAFSPDGGRIVTASFDNTARLWDASTGRQIATLAGHDSWVLDAEFSPDGRRIVTASYDNTARLWDAVTGIPIVTLLGHISNVNTAVFSPDGARIVTASSDNTVRLWDTATGKTIATLASHNGSVFSAAFSPDAGRIVTASKDKTARVWDLSTIPKGNLFQIACAWLPDHDLSDIAKEYRLTNLAPICEGDAPLPDQL